MLFDHVRKELEMSDKAAQLQTHTGCMLRSEVLQFGGVNVDLCRKGMKTSRVATLQRPSSDAFLFVLEPAGIRFVLALVKH